MSSPETSVPVKPIGKRDRVGVSVCVTAPHGQRRLDFSVPIPSPDVGEILYLLLFPMVAFLGLHYLPRYQNRTLDPYIYTGFINNFVDLFHRYGVTYYGVRFGLILPARALTSLLGPEVGYAALRYLLALLFGISLYAVCKRFLSQATAVLLYAIAVGTPYFARALLWDHPDATGVPFLTAAICICLLDEKGSRRRGLIAGCCAGMAIHSNVFTLAHWGLFLLIYAICIMAYKRDLMRLCRLYVSTIAGCLLVTVAGSLYYGLTVGHFDIFSITISTANSLSHGGFNDWRLHGAAWTLLQYHVFVPVWLAVSCGLIVGFRRPPFFAAVVTCFGVALTSFYYIHQFLLDGDSLQLFYYFSYAAPAVFLMLGVLLEHFYSQVGGSRALFVGLGVSSVFLPLLTIASGTPYFELAHSRRFFELVTLLVALILVIRVSSIRLPKRWLALMGIIIVGESYNLGFAEYGSVIQNRATPDTAEVDVYRVALQFIKAMPKFSGDPGDLLFLYDTREQSVSSVQSTYLWGYSWVKYERGGASGKPHLGPAEVARISQARYLGLIGETVGEIDSETKELRDREVRFHKLDERRISSGGYAIYWRLLGVAQEPRTTLVNGDFESGTAPWTGGWADLKAVDGGHSGKCLELVGQRGDSQFAMDWNALRLESGMKYSLHFWVKSGSSGNEGFRVGLWDNRDVRWIAYRDGVSSREWEPYVIEFTAPSDHLLSCELMKNSGTKGSMLFDSVELAPSKQ